MHPWVRQWSGSEARPARPKPLPSLDVERTGTDAINANQNRDPLAVLVHVLLHLKHAVPDPLREFGIVDHSCLAVKAERALVSGRVANEHSDLRITRQGLVGLALRSLPPGEVIRVPDHEASLQGDVRLTVV